MKIIDVPSKLVILMIRIYQKFLSTDHAFWARPEIYRVCTFHPSCSQYSIEAIEKHGLLKGIIMGMARIVRCNPWTGGGIDKVPDKFSIYRNSGKL